MTQLKPNKFQTYWLRMHSIFVLPLFAGCNKVVFSTPIVTVLARRISGWSCTLRRRTLYKASVSFTLIWLCIHSGEKKNKNCCCSEHFYRTERSLDDALSTEGDASVVPDMEGHGGLRCARVRRSCVL